MVSSTIPITLFQLYVQYNNANKRTSVILYAIKIHTLVKKFITDREIGQHLTDFLKGYVLKTTL